MNYCTLCGQHYYGTSHSCLGYSNIPYTTNPINYTYTLDRIATALEKLISILEKQEVKDE